MSAPTENHWADSIKTDVSGLVRAGKLVVGGFLVTFGAWSVLAPIAGAVTVIGTVVSTGNNKELAHPVGGRVTEILRKEGEHVEPGDVILRLDPTTDKAAVERLMARRYAFLAQESRLKAERAGTRHIAFPNDLLDASRIGGNVGQEVDKLLEDQRAEFKFSVSRHAAELDVLKQQKDALARTVVGLKARYSAKASQVSSLSRQNKKMKRAVRSGYLAQNVLLDNERRLDEIKGEMLSLEAEIESSAMRRLELDSRIDQVTATRFEKNGVELTRVRTQLAELEKQLAAARHVADQTEVKASVAGTVARLSTTSVGSVIKPGDPICEIVPEGKPLEAEARVATQDIANVSIGQEADVFVTAFSRRLTTTMVGQVTYISPDSFLDDRTGSQYFIVRVGWDGHDVADANQQIKSGMTAEVYIKTGGHTFVAYMVKPVVESFRGAFRER